MKFKWDLTVRRSLIVVLWIILVLSQEVMYPPSFIYTVQGRDFTHPTSGHKGCMCANSLSLLLRLKAPILHSLSHVTSSFLTNNDILQVRAQWVIGQERRSHVSTCVCIFTLWESCAFTHPTSVLMGLVYACSQLSFEDWKL